MRILQPYNLEISSTPILLSCPMYYNPSYQRQSSSGLFPPTLSYIFPSCLILFSSLLISCSSPFFISFVPVLWVCHTLLWLPLIIFSACSSVLRCVINPLVLSPPNALFFFCYQCFITLTQPFQLLLDSLSLSLSLKSLHRSSSPPAFSIRISLSHTAILTEFLWP